jgi:hypothetical protein
LFGVFIFFFTKDGSFSVHKDKSQFAGKIREEELTKEKTGLKPAL